MIDGITYRVGTASLPLFPHPEFKEWDAAVEEALLQTAEEQSVIAVWELNAAQDTMTVLCLVFLDKIWVVWEGEKEQQS